MVVHGQLVQPAVCLSDLYEVFLLDIIRDTRQSLWTTIYRSQFVSEGYISNMVTIGLLAFEEMFEFVKLW